MKFILNLIAMVGLICSVNGQTKKKSLFWKVSGNGLKTSSYLYGTMHTGDERVYNFSSKMEKAFKKADVLALELNMDSVNQLSVMAGLIMKNDITLKDLLSEDDYALTETFFKDSVGQPLVFFNKMQPIFTASMIAAKDLGNQKEQALDMYFFSKAKQMNKTVKGLEKMEEQIGAFSAIPYDKQAQSLIKGIKEAYDSNAVKTNSMNKMMTYYIEGDLEALADLSTEVDKDDLETSALFTEVFLTKRNHHMADRSVPLMKSGSTFIAVGAAHLGGKQGLIQLLRDKGYTVKAQ